MLHFAHQSLPTSYYTATAHPWTVQPALQDSVYCDVCVVGAGMAGLSTALHLQEKGFAVIVLEGAQVGFGASGRNGGQVVAGFSCNMDVLQQQVGTTVAQTMWDMSIEGIRLVEQRIQQHHIACNWTRGNVCAALKARHIKRLEQLQHTHEQYGYTGTQLWDRATLQQHVSSACYHGGLFDPQAGQLHPLNYTLGLAHTALAAGVQLYEHTPAVRMEYNQAPKVITEQGLVNCKAIVLAGNVYGGLIASQLGRRIIPVGTYIIATEPLGEKRAYALIDSAMGVYDTAYSALHYYHLSADHRLLFGGQANYTRDVPKNLTRSMRQSMLKVFPQLADVKVEYTWGGWCDVTRNRAPDFGRLAPHVYYLQGFSGHGINITQLAGKIVAEAVAGEASRLDLFGRIKHSKFPGHPSIQQALLMLSMLYYQLLDKLL